MTSESFADAYVGYLDGFLTWDAIVPRPLPLAQAVYHDRAVFYGLATYPGESMDAKITKQAQLFVWGGMPGFALLPLDASAHVQIRNHLYGLARLKKRFEDWTVFGEMLRPPQMVSHAGFSGAPQVQSGIVGSPLPTINTPLLNTNGIQVMAPVTAVLSSAWVAPDGRVGVMVASTRAAPGVNSPVHLRIDRAAWGLGSGPLNVTVEGLNGPLMVSPSVLSGDGGISLSVAPQEVLGVVITP